MQGHSWHQCKSEEKFFWRGEGRGIGVHPIIMTTFLLSHCFAWNLRTFFSRQNRRYDVMQANGYWCKWLNHKLWLQSTIWDIGMSYSVGKLRKRVDCLALLNFNQKYLFWLRSKQKTHGKEFTKWILFLHCHCGHPSVLIHRRANFWPRLQALHRRAGPQVKILLNHHAPCHENMTLQVHPMGQMTIHVHPNDPNLNCHFYGSHKWHYSVS